MIKDNNKNATIKEIRVLKGISKSSNHIIFVTDDFMSSGSFETVLQEDWISYKGKTIQDIINVYGDEVEEFIRALDLMYTSQINTIPYVPEYIDIVFYAMHVGCQIDQISDASVTPRLKDHGYSIVMPERNGVKHRCIKKDGDNRMLMF